MKKFNMIIVTTILVMASVSIVAQNQLPRWALNGKEINFVNNQTNSTNQYVSTPRHASNLYDYYNESTNEYQRLFTIIDNNFWWFDNTTSQELYLDVDPITAPDYMFPEIVVAPRESNYCEYGTYYIFYILKKVREGGNKNDNNLYSYSLNYHIVDPERNTISSPTSYTLLGEAWDSELAAGLTITNFISGTNNRRLYYVYFDRTNNMNYIKFLTLTPTGVSGPYSVASFAASTKVLEPNEVEISEDMSKLVFVRPKTMQPNSTDYTNDLTIVHLNPSTGYINTALGTNGYTYVDLGPTNVITDKYVGVEFSEDGEKIFVTRSGTGVYSYNISSGIPTPINYTTAIANSQLELARDGLVYGIGENGQTYTINNNGVFATGAYNIGTSGVITNSYYGSGVSSRTLPEQIDRFAYDDLFGPRPSEVITTMPGVSHNSTTGDITITGSNVSWTQTSNPFTSGGQPITDVYLKGELKNKPRSKIEYIWFNFTF